MNLQNQQIEAAKRGEAVVVDVDEVEFVLLRKDVYDRVKSLLYDDSEWTEQELRSLLAKSAEASGWNEPEMEAYDNYDEELKKRCP